MDDLEFVQRCVSRDKDAWNEFVERYSRLIYSYIHSVLNNKGISAGEGYCADICQEIFHSLIRDNFKKLKSFRARNGCSLASWLRQVTVHAAIDYVRKIKPAVSMEKAEPDKDGLKDTIADSSISAAQALVNSEKSGALQECIERLNIDDKYFLELYLNRGVSLEKLKGHFNLSRSAIDMRKLRLVERLKDCFRSKGFEIG